MTESLAGTSWFLILSLVAGSAILAFLGDILGFKYGKQRISLFGLRPKYTSRIITAITGGIITVIVLAVLSVLSQDVRTALFSMKYVRQQLFDLQFQLNESRYIASQAQSELAEQQEKMDTAAVSLDIARMELDALRNDRLLLEQEKAGLETEVQAMKEESDQLKRALRTMKSETMAISANVLLAQTAFEPDTPMDGVLAGLEELKQQARLSVLRHVSDQNLSRLRTVPLVFDEEEEAGVAESIAGTEYRRYVRVLSRENVAFGEPIPVRLVTGYSGLIYSEGDIIYRKTYDAQRDDFDPEETLHTFLRDLKIRAIRDGVLPDPATNNVGTLGGEDFFDAVETLHNIHEPVIINAIASRDIYSEGPVVITLMFQE